MVDSSNSSANEQDESEMDPIFDIIDYLVRCANISFKNSQLNKEEIRTSEKIQAAYNLYTQSPTQFLLQFGKYLSPNHMQYFETSQSNNANKDFKRCLDQLKVYHSDECKNKRVRNRRYKAMQKLQNDTDYFSEKQMMYRNPLLYEQLVGQYLTNEEVRERDGVDNENFTFLNMILETVDRNEMRETKNIQMLIENEKSSTETEQDAQDTDGTCSIGKQWGDFDIPDTKPNYMPETQKQAMINANERNLLREEFLQEMYSSFIEGRDIDFDYNGVDNNEEYDDLQQISQDAEDKYFDSEDNDAETLEEHMQHVQEYGRKNSNDSNSDPLDMFMQHISNKLQQV
ncbi:coiled-coil domain-containing protein 97 [Maniola hyperantus]|uniref:coiled-coil domain-containing protein 97 n=1 Tax=Aphantopus hyperantus TaxID=2795564 RepID=UPI00156A1412|nr:coiled-coil domain-containing protein 97 [Maniola hyperantus]